MKSFIAVLVAVAIAVGVSGSARAAESSPVITKKQAKALIQMAKTPADHMNLARYYRDEAKKLDAEAKDHEEMGADYFKNPSAHPIPKYPTLGQHCRDLSGYYAQAAKKAEEMASMHEEMARTVEK